MPKPQKQKQKTKSKEKAPETPGITTKKSYWIVLAVLFAVVSTAFGITAAYTIYETIFLVATIVLLISLIGFIRTTPSNLSSGRRAIFIFVGASIFGFIIWGALILTGVMTPFAKENDQVFVAITSFALCLIIGAFIGEMIGRSKAVQNLLIGL
jgi:cation transport ATPase